MLCHTAVKPIGNDPLFLRIVQGGPIIGALKFTSTTVKM